MTQLHVPADELMGDLLDYSLQADQSIVTWEPLRKVLPLPTGLVDRVRIGPIGLLLPETGS